MDDGRRKEMDERRDDLLRRLLEAPPTAGRKGREPDARAERDEGGDAGHSDPGDASSSG